MITFYNRDIYNILNMTAKNDSKIWKIYTSWFYKQGLKMKNILRIES